MEKVAPGGKAGDEEYDDFDERSFVQEQNEESISEEENKFVSFLKGLAKMPVNFVNELFGAHDAEAAALTAATSGGQSAAAWLWGALLSGRYIVSGSSVVDVATGAVVVESLPIAMLALVPYLEYSSSRDTLNSLLAEVQRSVELGVSEAKINAALNVNIDGDGPSDLSYEATIGLLNLSRINHQEAQKQKELSASGLSAKISSENSGLEEDEGLAFFKKEHGKNSKAPDVGSNEVTDHQVMSAVGGPNQDPNEDKFDQVCRHSKYKKIYRGKDGMYYSKDLGGDRAHGGEHWKQFKLVDNKKLIHQANIDPTTWTEIKGQNKGPVGREIPWSEIFKCKNIKKK